MRTIKGKARGRFINAYRMSPYTSLAEVYTNPSQAKLNAEERCMLDMYDDYGYDFRIISYNTFTFTCGWRITHPETGVVMLRVETANNSYIMEY